MQDSPAAHLSATPTQLCLSIAPESPNRAEFERRWITALPSLRGYAIHLLRDPDEADDLLQDVTVRALAYWHLFRPGSSITAWGRAIVHNTLCNRYRSGKTRDRHTAAYTLQATILGHASPPPDPDEVASASEACAIVLEALDMVPPEQRMAVTLADLEGHSYQEIADIMDCPIGTVMSRIYRGRQALRKAVESIGADL